MSTTTQDEFPMVELAPIARPVPLVEPRLATPSSNVDDIGDGLRESSMPSFLPDLGYRSHKRLRSDHTRAKRESYNMSGSTYLITNTGKTLKLPVPSDSASDPLNFSRWKTAGAISSLALFSTVSLTASQAASVLLGGLQLEFEDENIPTWLMKALITGPTLFMGIGCFLWVPLSIGLGRRPTVLLATIVMLIAMIWAGEAQSFRSLVSAVCFLGFGEGLSLSVTFLIMIDLTYINQRAKGVALMWSVVGFFGTCAVGLVPVIADHGRHWRDFYHYWMIPLVVSSIATFFLLPETYFKRPTVAFDGLILLQSATETLTVYQDAEKDCKIYRDLPEYPLRTGFAGLRDRLGLARSPFASWASMGCCFVQMGHCAVNPLIFWVFIASAFNTAGMIFIGATYTRILLAPPYNISPNVVGTVNVACGFGSLIGYLVWSVLIWKVITRLSARNRGVLEAEHFLIGYIVPVLSGALSTLLHGLAVQRHWGAPVYWFAYGINGLSFTTLMIANTLWVTEAFPRWAAPALAVVGGGCYLFSFGMSFTLVPWIEKHGFEWVGIELTIFQIVGGLIALPVAFWGKSARQSISGRWADDRSGALRPL